MADPDLLQFARDSASSGVDLFAMLSLDPLSAATATESEIRSAYRKKALTAHPDKTGDKYDPVLYENLGKARDVLLSAEARAIYEGGMRAALQRKQQLDMMGAKRRRLVTELEEREKEAENSKKRRAEEELGDERLKREMMEKGRRKMEERRREMEEAERREKERGEEEEKRLEEQQRELERKLEEVQRRLAEEDPEERRKNTRRKTKLKTPRKKDGDGGGDGGGGGDGIGVITGKKRTAGLVSAVVGSSAAKVGASAAAAAVAGLGKGHGKGEGEREMTDANDGPAEKGTESGAPQPANRGERMASLMERLKAAQAKKDEDKRKREAEAAAPAPAPAPAAM
ncbi:hypothetical protein QBC42DRAFT_293253 [Cladorrhinum samala]|uniref:J domain-containing protein n=1 Tax=Cladorrhinum samala TaxID=585594 RepID=A0AAV9I527_9PEZI|nr:hypothetical protein QBC42DRAFT_293253 [Cladorrhinum samala]